MNITQVKQRIIKRIDLADERILRAIDALLESYIDDQEQIVAFTGKGQPITKSELIESVLKADEEVMQGKGFSSDDIRKAKENW